MRRAPAQARVELVARLRARRGEIEHAVLTRVHSISDPSVVSDPAYTEGLRRAVSAAVDYGLEGIERGEQAAPAPPPELFTQVRAAASGGVNLDTVLRRYIAGYALLGDFLLEEAEQGNEIESREIKYILRGQSAIFDRVVAEISEEYGREKERRFESTMQRRRRCVERLLDGESVDTSILDYDFHAHHIGLLAVGREAADWIRHLAGSTDSRQLVVPREDGLVWAWLGSGRSLSSSEIRSSGIDPPPNLRVAFGEPAEGRVGWRLTHRQAAAALRVALHQTDPVICYADVALAASVLQDDLLTTSLRQLYLQPLECWRDNGKSLRKTLRAYFAADRNTSSAAAALGVNRSTVTNHLRVIEDLISRPISSCAGELEAALQLDEISA